MALPKLQVPTFELKLPSNGKKIKYRSFLVKEEKLLMIANETGNEEERSIAISQIIENCTFSKLNAFEMPTFDLEYLFLNIRSKSVSEIAEVKVLCPDDNETYVPVSIDLNDVKCRSIKKNENIIKLDDSVGVVLKYPTIKTEESDDPVTTICGLIGSIYDSDNVFEREDFTEEELRTFIESMSQKQLNLIAKFYENIPRITIDVPIVNPKTQVESKVTLIGLDSFF